MFKKKLNAHDLMELVKLNDIIINYRFTSIQVKGNSALVPKGKELAEQFEKIADIMEQTKNSWVSNKLMELGFPAGSKSSIDLKTGKITLQNA